MVNGLQITTDRKNAKIYLEKTTERMDANVDEDRQSLNSPVVSDINRPYGSPESSQFSDGMNNVESDEDMI